VALFGCARVSTGDQKLALQHDTLNAAGCERIFDDHASEAKTDRPGLPWRWSICALATRWSWGKLDRLEQIVQQRCRTSVITDLSSGHDEDKRAAVRIGNSMKLGVHTAFGATNQAPEIYSLTGRLDALRCAFR
jgi:hypothetical protein